MANLNFTWVALRNHAVFFFSMNISKSSFRSKVEISSWTFKAFTQRNSRKKIRLTMQKKNFHDYFKRKNGSLVVEDMKRWKEQFFNFCATGCIYLLCRREGWGFDRHMACDTWRFKIGGRRDNSPFQAQTGVHFGGFWPSPAEQHWPWTWTGEVLDNIGFKSWDGQRKQPILVFHVMVGAEIVGWVRGLSECHIFPIPTKLYAWRWS